MSYAASNLFGGFAGTSGYRSLQESYGDGASSTDSDDMYDEQFFVYSAFGGYPGGFYHGLSFAQVDDDSHEDTHKSDDFNKLEELHKMIEEHE